MAKIYVASKFGEKEYEVQDLQAELKERGHLIVYDWTAYEVKRPFEDHPEQAHEAAERMARAVMVCDVLIVITAPNGVGYHIETGGALVTGIIQNFIAGQPAKKIIVIGYDCNRSVFYFHSSVTRVKTVAEALKLECLAQVST